MKTPWTTFFKFGLVDHEDGAFSVDDGFCRDLIAAFNWFRDTYGYLPPLAGQHPEEIPEMEESTQDLDNFPAGIPYGLITDLRVHADELQFKAKLTDHGKRWWSSMRHFSPSIWKKYKDRHSGRVFAPALREISAVVVPHLKNISARTMSMAEFHIVPEHIGFSEWGTDDLLTPNSGTEGDSEMDETLKKMLEEIQAKLAELGEKVNAMEAPGEVIEEPEVEMEDEPESTDMSEAQKTALELKKFKREVQRDRAIARTEKDMADVADQKLITSLAEVRLSQGEEAYLHLSKAIIAAKSGTTQAPIGSAVSVPNESTQDDKDFLSLAEDAIAKGVKPTKFNEHFVEGKKWELDKVLNLKAKHRDQIRALYNTLGGN